MWKCVIDSEDLKTFECTNDNVKICIEARQSKNFWEIFKTYRSKDITFTEEYEANNVSETNEIINKMKSEIMDQETLTHINHLRKNLSIKIKRAFKDHNVEKWNFAVNSDKFKNVIIVRYAEKEIEMDIIADEHLKFIEGEILDEIYRILGMNEFKNEVVQNIYFFSKKSSFFNDNEEKSLLNQVEVGFKFESDDNLD